MLATFMRPFVFITCCVILEFFLRQHVGPGVVVQACMVAKDFIVSQFGFSRSLAGDDVNLSCFWELGPTPGPFSGKKTVTHNPKAHYSVE